MINLIHNPNGYIFPDRLIQTTIIDPPYNIGFDYKSDFDDKMSIDEYNKFIFDAIEGCYKHSREDASLFLINYPEIIFELNTAIQESSWKVHQFIHWVYKYNITSKKKFTRSCRTILWLTKDKPKIYIDRIIQPYKDLKDPRNIKLMESGKKGCHLYNWWEINIVKGNSKQHLGYVNQIPYEVLKRLILTTTDEGDLIYDPMCGSGSTVYVSDILGIYGFGCDISPVASDVWSKYTENPFKDLVL